jgi:hypothetical protein
MGEEKNEILIEKQDKVLEDHEQRLRKLEESDIKQQIQLAEISKSQSDLKVLVMESSKEQSKTLKEANDKMLEAILGNNKIKNDIKLKDRKEIWAILSAVATALIAFFLTK